MHTRNFSKEDLLTEIAKAADLCMKPWRYSVKENLDDNALENSDELVDLILIIECRNQEGERFPERDLELEIFKSSSDLSITLSWRSLEERPILWQGRHPVWMDSFSGKRCQPPENSSSLEVLARRLRAFMLIDESG